MGMKFMFLAFLVFLSFFFLVRTEPIEDKQALLQFAQNIHHSVLNWDQNSSACKNWTGITCNQDESWIIAVRLPAVGLRGPIPMNTLSRLSALELLSLRFNAISGPFPSDFYKLGNLTELHLQFNEFFGSLPLDFSVWQNVRVIDLSNNGFNGSVPVSISNLSQLTSLNLANNSISGELPDLNIPSLRFLDLSYNDLTGNVPESLRRFSSSAFVGNRFSPGNFNIPPAAPPSAQTSEKSTELSESAILGIAVSGLVMGFVILFVLLIVCHSNKSRKNNVPVKPKTKEKTMKKAISLSQDDESTSLVFFQGSNLAFDLEDLLRASAEVLGKGTFGTTYKAALEDSATVVVKRLKEGCVLRREFEQQMEVVGSIKHENVASLRAYYYSKDEKLVVYDYFGQGSVSTMLHSKSGHDQTSVNWETRLRIAVGAARGIAHIHTKNTTIVHGNIKASNIFLNSQQEGCVCDLGLATLMSPVATPVVRTPGYRAPEVTDTRKVSQASDVYSFGVLLLELLTGKSPVRTTGSDEVVNLVRWVNSVVREEWTAEVFDVGLLKYPNIEEEMVEMLQIGMACVARVPEQRPKMADVLKVVEDIGRINTGNQPSSRNKSQASTPTPTTTEMGSPFVL